MPVASGRFGDDAAVGGSLALVHAVCFLLHVSCNVACCIGVPRYVTSGAISGPIVPLDLRTMCVTIAVLTKHRNRRPGHVTLCQAEPAWAVLQRACCMFVGCTPEYYLCVMGAGRPVRYPERTLCATSASSVLAGCARVVPLSLGNGASAVPRYLKDLTLLGSTMWPEPVMPNLVRYIEAGEIKPLVSATC